jgi:hypothetical protein
MTTPNFFIVHMTNLETSEAYKYVGIYSTKEKADEAGQEACELCMMKIECIITVTLDVLDK